MLVFCVIYTDFVLDQSGRSAYIQSNMIRSHMDSSKSQTPRADF